MRMLGVALWLVAWSGVSAGPVPRQLWLVVGAPGEEIYGTAFASQAKSWRDAAGTAGDFEVREIRDRGALEAACQSEAIGGAPEVWIVLIGHGTFDGRIAKFNMDGPDVSAGDLAGWLKARTGALVVVHTGECSGPFLTGLSGKDRAIVTATQSGNEVVATRFGGYLAEALRDPAADLSQDGGISLLEAFLVASGRTAGFYEKEGLLASEHALIDDNGDGKGTRADWFTGLRVVKKSDDGSAADGGNAKRLHLVPGPEDRGLTAEERVKRDRLEAEVEGLRGRRAELGDEAWYDALEAKFLELGKLRGSRRGS